MKKFLFLFSLLSIISCHGFKENKTKTNDSVSFTLPENSIPISSSFSEIKFNTKLNDSITTEITFDTGLPQEIIIDSAFASKHNLLTDVNFKKKIALYQIKSNKPHGAYFSFNNITFTLQIANYQKEIKNFYIIDLEKTYGCKSDILAGCSLLEDKLFEINYSNSYLRFFQDTGEITNLSAYNCFNLHKINRTCYALSSTFLFGDNCTINSKLMLDIGSPRLLMITNMNKKDITNIQNSTRESNKIKALDVFSRTRYFYLCKLTIDNKINYPLIFEEPIAVLSPSSEYNGIIGNQFLMQHNPIFDFINKKLYLHKTDVNKVFKNTSLGIETGFFTYKNNFVTGVVKNSEAEKLGLKPNDSIISVDNIPIDSLVLKEYLIKKAYDDNITLKIKRNNDSLSVKIKKRQHPKFSFHSI